MKEKITILFLILSFFSFSCQKDEQYLEDAIPSVMAASEPVSNAELESLLYGCYFSFCGFDRTGSPFDGLVSYPILASGEAKWQTLAPDGTYKNIDHWYTRNNLDIDIMSLEYWTHSYYVVHQCNIVISKIGQFTDNKEKEPRMEGQARFLRALSNYALVLGFAPPYGSDNNAKAIILYDETSMSGGPQDLRSRNTVEEAYQAIIHDLEVAIEKLPANWDGASEPAMARYKILPYKSAAQMALARVYFNMGKEHWDKALTLVDALLSDSRYGLEADPRAAYDLAKNAIPGPETIWCISSEWWTWHNPPFIWRSCSYDMGNSTFDYRGVGRSYTISDQMLEYMGWNDTIAAQQDLRYVRNFQRYEAGEDPIPLYQAITEPAVWPIKFEVSYRASIQMMRVAELYLDRAIILFNKGDKAGAAAALKVIRDRAGLPEISAGAITEEDIHKERARELVYEGDWLHYRQCQRMDILPGDLSGSPIPWDDPSLVLPVPLNEKSSNPDI